MMTLVEYKKQFGKLPNNKDCETMSKKFIKAMKAGLISTSELVEGFGPDWTEYLLKYNTETEEYERCSVIRDALYEYRITKELL
jgi:hypothetical protein